MVIFQHSSRLPKKPPRWDTSDLLVEAQGATTLEEKQAAVSGVLDECQAFIETKLTATMKSMPDAIARGDVGFVTEALMDYQALRNEFNRIHYYVLLESDANYQDHRYHDFKSDTNHRIDRLRVDAHNTLLPIETIKTKHKKAFLKQHELDESLRWLLEDTIERWEYDEAPAPSEIPLAERDPYAAITSTPNMPLDERERLGAQSINNKLAEYEADLDRNQSFLDRFCEENAIDSVVMLELATSLPERLKTLEAEVERLEQDLPDSRAYDTRVRQTECGFTWKEASTLIIEAFADFHPELGELAETAIRDGWVYAERNQDTFHNPNAREGYPQSQWAGGHPYVLSPFHGTMHSIRGLSHELGHAIQLYLTTENPNNPRDYVRTAPLGETVAHIMENHVADYIIEHEKNPFRKHLLEQVSLERSTFFPRLVKPLQAEHQMNEAYLRTGDLTGEQITDLFLHASPDAPVPPEKLRNETIKTWTEKSHYHRHNPYYRSSYIFAELLGSQVCETMKAADPETRAEMADAWVQSLRNFPSETLGSTMSIFGIDINQSGLLTERAERIYNRQIESFKRETAMRSGEMPIPAPTFTERLITLATPKHDR